MARDTAGEPPEGTPQADVWNRHQMETDDPGDDPNAVRRTDLDDETAAGGLSGGGQPSGESHWERTENKPAG
jgi:hypothetical protein